MEQSFSNLTMIKRRQYSRQSNCSVAQLMRITIEGPEIDVVEFEKIMEILRKIVECYFDYVV